MVPSAVPVPSLLGARAAADPGHEALAVAGSGGLTLRDWDERSDAAARGLLEHGVRRGDRVALVFGARDWIAYAVCWMGVLKAGAVAVPLSDRLAVPELTSMIGHCGATLTVHGAGPPPVPGALPAGELNGRAEPPPVELDPLDLAQILYTSGTTGTPKGVAATHANLTSPPVHPKRRPFAHSRHLVHAFPIGTNAGQVMLLHALTAAPTVVTLPLFTPARFAALVEERAAGTVFVVPAMAIELLNARVHERHDLSSVLLLGSAAAALPPPVAARLAGAFPSATVVNYYTSTEAAPAQTIMVFDPDRPGALGRAAGGSTLKIATADGEPVAPGETGEVWMRAAAHPRAYYGERGGTFRDGWVRMGDLGRLDADGYLYLVDRESDVIKSGAFKVSTLQVEAALHEHPSVAEASVFGVPHPVMGMAVAAAVVPREPLTLPQVRAFLGERLAAHELPTRLLCLDALPRNTAGKVVKRELRRLAEEHAGT
ncbi:class I adenylate-forming enzyme family protein [Nonomuraea roseoviolacea]|uniref:Acyl-CoA synthetase (AMP-forming)/AMP-acid ligase II n=1 Tax=Nonomuraea roseoviolacea subsp. carminata TaxID=160689 RepID=A0ABT1JVU9_9ACTN|nr:AMP-binding protein [Nonomuraea roseoviolacea]MCP2345522.1 acyl-CoA synthetase (AMP-forming)/AMP-acid ligase II [Nonomuraea roseoviolacea subsp. carminata]